MQKFIKGLICATICSIMISNNSFATLKLNYDGAEHNYTAEPITLIVDGKILNPDVPPVIIDESTLVPARAVFEQLGATVLWVEEAQEIFIILGKDILNLKVGDNRATVNNELKTMKVAPKIINGSTMIPLRFVSESLNFEVSWDSKKRIALVNSVEIETQASINQTLVQTDIPTEQSSSLIEVSTNQNLNPSREQNSNQNETFISQTTSTEQNSNQTGASINQSSNQSAIFTEQGSSQTEGYDDIINTPVQGQNGEVIRFKGSTNYPIQSTPSSNIKSENNPLVNIIGIDFPNNGEEAFKINADGRISDVTFGMIESRLFLDITNSASKLNSNITVTGSNLIKSIRTAPQGNDVTRVVFDDAPQNYNISLSDDRKSIYVKFKSLNVNEITFQNIGKEDIINIYSDSGFTPIITEISNPDRLIIDVPNSTSTIGSNAANVAGNSVSAIRTSQFDNSTVRIVLDLTKIANYQITKNNLCTTVKILEPTYKNIKYENNNDPRLVLKKNTKNIDINSIIHQDKYLEGYYKITLSGDYSDIYGFGKQQINDIYLNSIEIKNNNGNTEFIFNEKNIYAYTVTEDEQNIYINILNPKRIYNNIVFLDPGHGGKFGGNVNNGVTEKVVNLDVSNRLYLLLENDPDIKVYASRTTDTNYYDDNASDLKKRAEMANQVAHMFVSIHCNSMENNSTVSGVQVFYRNPEQIEGKTSKEMATIFNKTVSQSLGIPIRPANQALGYDYAVLKYTTMPACLVEMGFLTNVEDAKILASPDGRQKAAQGLYEGIKEAFSTLINK